MPPEPSVSAAAEHKTSLLPHDWKVPQSFSDENLAVLDRDSSALGVFLVPYPGSFGQNALWLDLTQMMMMMMMRMQCTSPHAAAEDAPMMMLMIYTVCMRGMWSPRNTCHKISSQWATVDYRWTIHLAETLS